MQRYNLIPQRHIFRGLATYFELGDLFSGTKSLNSPCFVASWKGRIRQHYKEIIESRPTVQIVT